MPSLGGSTANTKRSKYKAYKRKLYHDFIRQGLASVRDAQRRKGFKCTYKGHNQLFYPVICVVVNDNPEGQLLALVYGSANAQFPCRMCKISRDDLNNPTIGLEMELRDANETIQTIQTAHSSRNAREVLKNASCK